MINEEKTSTQISEENKPENLVGQATPEKTPNTITPPSKTNPMSDIGQKSEPEPAEVKISTNNEIKSPELTTKFDSVKTFPDKPIAESTPAIPLPKTPVSQNNSSLTQSFDKIKPNSPTTVSLEANKAGVTIEKHGKDVTITEVMPVQQAQDKPTKSERKKDTFHSKSYLKSLLPKLKAKLTFRTEKRLFKIIKKEFPFQIIPHFSNYNGHHCNLKFCKKNIL